MRWIHTPLPAAEIEALSKRAGVNPVLAELLLRAGLGEAGAQDVRAFTYDAWAQGFSRALATLGVARRRW